MTFDPNGNILVTSAGFLGVNLLPCVTSKAGNIDTVDDIPFWVIGSHKIYRLSMA